MVVIEGGANTPITIYNWFKSRTHEKIKVIIHQVNIPVGLSCSVKVVASSTFSHDLGLGTLYIVYDI